MLTELPKPANQYSLQTKVKILFISTSTLLFLFFLYLNYLLSSPASAPTKIEVTSGQSVRSIAHTLEEANIVRSELLLYATLTYWYDPTKIFAGTYVFTGSETLGEVAAKLAKSDIENNLVRVTLPEGLRLSQMAKIASQVLPTFDSAEYLAATEDLEGFVFPDTYFVPEDYTGADLAKLQKTTYQEKIDPIKTQIENHELSEREIVILASIVEREAKSEESMRMVSGILQNRLAIGMALQADATMEYALNLPLNELKPGQLALEIRETDSPYNTYKYPGLPPTPIGNPGLAAITAILEATSSDYYYYITDEDGVFHYAKTLNEHNQNIARYLK